MKEPLPGEPYYNKVPHKLARNMSILWGEGSENLTKLIEYCIQHNIGTFASCKGHLENDRAYIGFTNLPKKFFTFIMDYMKSDKNVYFVLSWVGNHKPTLSISIEGILDIRENMFKKILEGVKEYDVLKKKIDVSSMNSTFAKEVEYIFSKDGYGKEKIILSNGYIIQERTITEKKRETRSGTIIDNMKDLNKIANTEILIILNLDYFKK